MAASRGWSVGQRRGADAFVEVAKDGLNGWIAFGVIHRFGGQRLEEGAVAIDESDLFLRLAMHAGALQVPITKPGSGHGADQQADGEDQT